MKKLLFLFSAMASISVGAQTLETQRVQYNGYTADIQPTIINDRRANIDIKNPYGNENITVEFQENENGQVNVIVKDKNTGKVLSTTEGMENKYVHSTSEINGIKKDLNLKAVGNDVTGTIGYSDQNKGEEIFANVLGSGAGLLNQTKQGYKMSLTMRGEDSATVTYTNAKTKEIVCILDDNNGVARVYDGRKKLIAEGDSEEDDPSKVYDESAWEKCAQVMDIFDDEDDD